ncbi:MAG: hypothetical protein ACO1OG_12415 [Devosia sp.]
MELLLLLVLVPIAWLLVMPRRSKRSRAMRFPLVGVLAGGAIAVWVGLQFFTAAPRPDTDYSAGDSELRAILLDPETAPRYGAMQR